MEDLTNQNAQAQTAMADATNPSETFQKALYDLISGSGNLNYTQIVGILELTKLEIVNRLFSGNFKTDAQ